MTSSFYRRYGKRVLDLALAIPACVVAAPGILLLALLVRLRMGRPVLFRQWRAGRGGAPFEIVKLRSMRELESASEPASAESRLTDLGRFLRRWSLDELPELWHVLRGDMSLVGPRPLPTEYLSRYDDRQLRRHDVLPGLTGWAQVNGRNTTSWARRLELDVWYCENLCLRLDLEILAKTFLAVASGVGASGRTPMPRFRDGEID